MTLVPIIYTSLVIFASFTFLVIVFSYISFKARSRNSPAGRQRSIVQPAAVYIPKPVFVQPQPVKTVPVRNSYPYSEPQGPVPYPKYQASYREPEYDLTERNRTREKPDQSQRNMRTMRRNPSRERLEIMNNSERFARDLIPEPNYNYRNAAVMLDANLLNYYSDGSELNFSIMNTRDMMNAV
jgi:hypothetical protein